MMSDCRLGKEHIEYDGEIPEDYIIPDKFLPPPHNQHIGGEDNRCVAYALSGIMTGLLGLEFSEAYIFGKYRTESNRKTDLLFESKAIPGVIQGGACLFEDMPDLKRPDEAYDYIKAHPELDEKAMKYANLFSGYVDLRGQTTEQTVLNIKKALLKYEIPIYGAISGHAIIFCGFRGDMIWYRDCDGMKSLKLLDGDRIRYAYLLVPKCSSQEQGDKDWGIGSPEKSQQSGLLGIEEQILQQDEALPEQCGIERRIWDVDFSWNGSLEKRTKTDYIVLHHRAGNGDVNSIHESHLANGWLGIGYHFYIRKDGSIYRGRPIDTVGAHATGYNSYSVGVCFEGNYEKDKEMQSAQLQAGQELICYLKELYPEAQLKRHRDLGSTACPGKYFPFDEIVNYEEDNMIKYNKLSEIPDWARPTIEKLMDKGSLNGDENGNLKLSEDMLRLLVILAREGVF